MDTLQHRILASYKDPRKRLTLLWLPLGVTAALVQWIAGTAGDEATIRALCFASGSSMIDYGLAAGVIRRKILNRSTLYEGQAAVVMGILHIIVGAISLAISVVFKL